jgi:8-oxo-dGTP diphosphatase
VVAGVVRGKDGKILICLRPKHLDQGGLWEFPGGKRESGEARFEALWRELKEELNIEITRATPLLRLSHRYATKTVDLDVWDVSRWKGQAIGAEGQLIEWVSPSALQNYDFPAANRTIIYAARLPRVISSIPDLAESPSKIIVQTEAWLNAGVRCFLARLRDIDLFVERSVLAEIAEVLRGFDAKLLLIRTPAITPNPAVAGGDSTVRRVAEKLVCDVIACSICCNEREVAQVEATGAELMLIGPVYSAGTELDGDQIGWNETARLVAKASTPAYGSGGLQPHDVQHAINAGCQGVVLGERVWAEDPQTVMISHDTALLAAEVRAGRST